MLLSLPFALNPTVVVGRGTFKTIARFRNQLFKNLHKISEKKQVFKVILQVKQNL